MDKLYNRECLKLAGVLVIDDKHNQHGDVDEYHTETHYLDTVLLDSVGCQDAASYVLDTNAK